MATVSNSDYDVIVHVQNIRLSDLTRGTLKPNGLTELPFDILKLDLSNLSYDKSDNVLEFNRLVSNYTGTLYFDETNGIDFNKRLPSDLELFSTNTTKDSSDDNQGIGDYSKYLRAVYINDGNNDILKIQLIGLGNSENELKLYKGDLLVFTIKYNDNDTRSHLLVFSSQDGVDTISRKLHEYEDEPHETSELETSKEFSSGKGWFHSKVSDCNICFISSDSTKNILAKTYVDNHNEYLVKPSKRIVNTSAITRKNRKIFLGVPSIP